jgi:hypothetical protein
MPATSVEETIYTILTTDATFMTAIGGSLYWRHAPVGATVPYVVFWQVDDPRPKERLCVYGGEARLQFNCYDTDAAAVVTASQTVVEKAREIRGTTNGLRLHAAVANVLTLPNVDDVAHRAVDWIVRYTEET